MSTRYPALTPAVVKAARAFLDLTQIELAEQVGISISTLRRYESARGLDMSRTNKQKILDFFKRSGLEILQKNDEIVGITRSGEPCVTNP